MSLAEGLPDLPYPKLPLRDAIILAYSTYFRHFTDALRVSWLWLIVVAAFTGYAHWQQWSWMAVAMATAVPPQMQKAGEAVLLLSFANILMLFAGVSIAVAWHRLLILNEQPGFGISNVVTNNLWRYVLIAIGLLLILFLPVMASMMFPVFYMMMSASSGALLSILLIFAAYAAGSAVALRLTLLLPAQAIGDTHLTFAQTWNRTRGNIWRLFWGVFATTVPPLLIVQIAFVVVMPPVLPGTAGENVAVRMTAMSTVFAVFYLLVVPIGIGFLSHAYRHFFQTPLELPE